MTTTVPLGELVEIRGGGTPSRSVPSYWGGPIPWATVKDFKSTILDITEESITPDGVANSATNVVPAGSIIVPTRMAVGKAAINAIDLAINQDLKALLPKDNVDRQFLLHFLLSKAEYLEGRAQGATVKGIKLDLLRSLEFPRLSIDEQRRIASILDKSDAIRRKRQQSLRLAESFVCSSFLERFGHPLDPDGKLLRSELAEHCDFFAGSSLPKGEEFLGQEDGLLLIKVSDLNAPGNEVSIRTAKLWAPSRSAAKGGVIAPRGSVVFPKRGGAIATNKKRILERDCVLDPNLMAVSPKPKSHISNNYMRMWFELIDLASISSGSSVPQLNKKDLAPLSFGVPDEEAVRWFDGVFQHVDRMRKQLSAALADAEAMFASVSQRAFRGEL